MNPFDVLNSKQWPTLRIAKNVTKIGMRTARKHLRQKFKLIANQELLIYQLFGVNIFLSSRFGLVQFDSSQNFT